MTPSFQSLFAPLSVEQFFGRYWQREVLQTRECNASIAGLIGLNDVEFLASSLTSVNADWMQVVKAGVPLESRAFCSDDMLAVSYTHLTLPTTPYV